MDVLRTPDERFAGLEGFDAAPHYVEVPRPDGGGTLRLHHLDEGPAGAAETVVLLHGEPSWSYLWRSVIPPLVAAGHRVVAPDLIGFGRSDKPADRLDYTYARHVAWLRSALFDALDLHRVTLVAQDWGGLLGLRLVAEHPERFARVVAANTGLPTGAGGAMSEAFSAWQRFSQEAPTLPVGAIVRGGTVDGLSDAEVAAYDAPFPDERYKEGARQFPVLVPSTPDDPARAANEAAWDSLARFERPFLCAFSDSDPITAGADRAFVERVPGARGQAHTTIVGAGHFLQEDRGPELAAVVLGLIEATPDAGR